MNSIPSPSWWGPTYPVNGQAHPPGIETREETCHRKLSRLVAQHFGLYSHQTFDGDSLIHPWWWAIPHTLEEGTPNPLVVYLEALLGSYKRDWTSFSPSSHSSLTLAWVTPSTHRAISGWPSHTSSCLKLQRIQDWFLPKVHMLVAWAEVFFCQVPLVPPKYDDEGSQFCFGGTKRPKTVRMDNEENSFHHQYSWNDSFTAADMTNLTRPSCLWRSFRVFLTLALEQLRSLYSSMSASPLSVDFLVIFLSWMHSSLPGWQTEWIKVVCDLALVVFSLSLSLLMPVFASDSRPDQLHIGKRHVQGQHNRDYDGEAHRVGPVMSFHLRPAQ
jgi:hypothetical protein